MKTKEKKELFAKTVEELKKLLEQSRDELFKLQLDMSQSKLKNLKEVFFKRKAIAMIMTAIREKEILSLVK